MPAAADEKVQIGALVGLLDVIDIQLCIPARGQHRFRFSPGLAASGEHVVSDVEVEPARFDIKLDHVAILHERERPPGGGFG